MTRKILIASIAVVLIVALLIATHKITYQEGIGFIIASPIPPFP